MFSEFYDNQIPLLYKKARLEDFQESQPKLVNFSKNWVKNPGSLFIYGPCGVGKTHFTYALVRELAIRNPIDWPRFYSSPQLDSILLEAVKSDQGDAHEIGKICECGLLIIDDIGREMKTDRQKRQYFEIIDHRYSHGKITIMTSNWNPSRLHEVFDDAILSRLQNSTFIEMEGVDRRRK